MSKLKLLCIIGGAVVANGILIAITLKHDKHLKDEEDRINKLTDATIKAMKEDMRLRTKL